MKIETLSVKSIITNRDGLHNYFGWPSVARLRDGRLAAGASGFRYYHKCPFGKAVLSFSSDEGKSWSLPAVVLDSPLDDRDCGIVPFGESGMLVTSCNAGPQSKVLLHGCDKKPKVGAYISAYLDLMRDKDEAVLEKLSGSLYRISYDNGNTFGEIRKAPVSSPHGPIVLPDGNFFWVGNRITYDGDGLGKILSCYKFNTDGDFEHLSDIKPIEGFASYEPYACVLKSGKIIVHIRAEIPTENESMFTLYQCESYDGGKTFTDPHSIGLEKTSGAPPHIIDHDGVLISVYAHRNHPHQIRAAFSYDEGETWDGDNVIVDLPDLHGDFGYPCSVALNDGSILTVYYGADEGSGNWTFWAGKDTPIYEFETPCVRQVIWRYCKD